MWFVNFVVALFYFPWWVVLLWSYSDRVARQFLESNFLAAAFLAEGGAVKVERSRARGHVASNTFTASPGAIHWSPRNCFPPIPLNSVSF